MSQDNTRNVILAFIVLCVVVQTGFTQDWTRWRGANGDGVVTGFTAPKAWPDQLKRRWQVTVGVGHSSPLVVGGNVYLHSRQGENEVAAAYDLNTGKTKWQDSYPVAYTMNPAATGHGKGPKSTPVYGDGKLYTFGITEILSCYDAAKGKLLWRKDFSKQFKSTSPDFGASTSPIIDRGLLIVFVGGGDGGALKAFDAATGEEKWSWNGDGPAYATPIVVEIDGKRQVVTQSQQNIIGVQADDGSLLWKIPFTTAYVQNIVTPIRYKDLLIFSGIDKGVFAVRVGLRDNRWATDAVWENKEVPMYMNSPLLAGGLLFGMSHKNKGQFFCLDAATGKTLWTGDPRQGENAAMVIAGDTIFSLTNDADLIVTSAADKGAKVIKKYHVAEKPTWAHPAITGRSILIKDESTLAVWGLD
ncbi:MAG TPA: PQQ-binding-like beta-propeller repeat protein [Blastocatellia bacterium]|jgi:outer membrane protein assembly factor BamB|nr:PQQ-binding-like beta-propeller repeat protein [Blastocatellia bacterium]